MPTEQNPILNNPYEEPQSHYATNLAGELDYSRPVRGRRIFTPEVQTIPMRQGAQGDLMELNEVAAADHGSHVVNLLRRETGAWRQAKYPQTTRITRELLQFWFLNPERDMTQSLFFAQREAIETAIWLNEIAEKSNVGQHILRQLEEARKVSASPENNLPRIAFKMATGSGKTVVMGALIAYHYFNRAEYRNDVRFADNFLLVAYLHIGPKFGTVSKQAVTEAIKACRDKRDGDWLLIMGFAFESGITELSRSFGNFQVSIVRMHDDLLQLGLLKKDKKAASFVTIGEPDIKLHKQGDEATVEIAGLDIYDPIKDEVKSRDVHDIAYWMVDDAYDGSNFVTRQVFFCGGDKDEFDEWKRGLSDLAKAKRAAEQTLKIELDDEAFTRLYGHTSHPFPVKKGQKIAVRVISQFGEETTKVLEVK